MLSTWSLTLLLVVLYSSIGTIAQSSLVCSSNQCLQGPSDITIGETLLSESGSLVQLLPGEYTSQTNPQLLRILRSTTAGNLSQSPGFSRSSFNPLPINISLDAGHVIYANSLYAGQATFSPLPSTQMKNSLPLPASSLALSKNVWMALTSGLNNNSIIFWEAVPDVSQLPSAASQSLALVDIQSYACSPACSGSAVCLTSGKCNCPPGFTGSSCEACAKGFFGPTCQPCPSQCKICDQGLSGSGQCLVPLVSNAPATCNCVNGQCGSDGSCACNIGWTKSANRTACAVCAPGFFLTSSGDCLVCQFGCAECADLKATCLLCQKDFTQDPNDHTKCAPKPAVTSKKITCPDRSYNAGNQCNDCSSSCTTCNGPSTNNCITCPPGQVVYNGTCITPDSNGVCEGTDGMIADNNKQKCDACGAKCTSCEIPNFDSGSTVSQLRCTACLLGSFLSQGRCAESCPSGSFVSPKDNSTCTTCTTPCATCSSDTYCLTCNPPLLASSGQCVTACPSGTFNSSGACIKCHPDCASCSGTPFNKCSSCYPTRPVLTSGRCLPTCVQSQYFDLTNSTCKGCDPSCSSCSGPGSANCLACSNPTQVLRAGSCVSANCTGSSNVVPHLGICLSELVQASDSASTSTSTTAFAFTFTDLSPSETTSVPNSSSTGSSTSSPSVGRRIAWWEILLMVLGGIFVLVLIVMLWRRCMRKQRVEETVQFVGAKEERLRMRDKWMKAVDDGEHYNFNPERIYMDDRHDPDRKYRSSSVYSHSVYSQDMNMAWQETGAHSIRNSVYY